MKKNNEHVDAKIVIYSRIDPGTIAALDQIRESMKPVPTRAQLIDLAVAQYVERNAPKKKPHEGKS